MGHGVKGRGWGLEGRGVNGELGGWGGARDGVVLKGE